MENHATVFNARVFGWSKIESFFPHHHSSKKIFPKLAQVRKYFLI
jgi:hypothetical protein